MPTKPLHPETENHQLEFLKNGFSALAYVGHHLANRKVTGSISGQGTCLDCGPGPWSGSVQKASDWCFSPSFFPSLHLSLESIKENKFFFKIMDFLPKVNISPISTGFRTQTTTTHLPFTESLLHSATAPNASCSLVGISISAPHLRRIYHHHHQWKSWWLAEN